MNRLIHCVAALVGLAATSALADPSSCTAIEDDGARLACYDALFAPPSEGDIDATGNWQVRTETSKFDDSTKVYLSLSSSEQSNCRYDTAPHQIWAACRENTTNVWIWFGGCFMSSTTGRGEVTYRVDKLPARTKRFRESNDNEALGLWSGGQAIPFLKELMGHDTLVLRATPFSESTVTAEYDITGLDQALAPLRNACNW